MIEVGIVGGSGYTGGELIRLLINHPSVQIKYIYSTTKAGQKVSDTHPDLTGILELAYTDEIAYADVIFLCTGHGTSRDILASNEISADTKIVDLSRDFRLIPDSKLDHRKFIYGLPALCREDIIQANNVANPGCFATAIQLALLPLADASVLTDSVHINATTGSTGAGAKLTSTTHYSWRSNNMSWYKAFTHQHLGEITQSLTQGQETLPSLFFIPNRGTFTRGIYATSYTHCSLSIEESRDLYDDFYKKEPYVHISDQPIALKNVINTNNCHIHLHKEGDILLITSVIDNLLKGASGQAVQNMNLMCGLDETSGLQLKSTFF